MKTSQTETVFTSEALEYESLLTGRMSDAVKEVACKIAADRGDNVVVSNDIHWAMVRVLRRCAEDREFYRRLVDDEVMA